MAMPDKPPEQVSLPGLAAVYRSLHPHQLALYHGVPLDVARRIKAESLAKLPGGTPVWRDVVSMGGFRSGKTFAAAYKLLRHMMREAGGMALVTRKRHEQLQNTFMAEFFKVAGLVTKSANCPACAAAGIACAGHPEWLVSKPRESAGSLEVTVQTYSGKPSKIVFRIEPDGADEDIQNSFKGYELCAFVMEEASELRRITFDTLRGRLSWLGGTMGLVLSNPVYAGHWLAEFRALCDREMLSYRPDLPESEFNVKPEALAVRSATEDNLANLPSNYLEDQKKLYRGREVEYQMFLMGFDGVKIEGRPCFAGAFEREQHVVECEFNPHRPLIRGWDFGYHNPACVFMQVDDQGCLNVLAEYREKEIYIEGFVDAVKAFTTRTFPVLLAGIEDFGDHAGTQETDKQGTSIQRAFMHGNVMIKSRPNPKIENGLNQMRKLMRTRNGPRCRFQIHPRCTDLIMALAFGYHYQVYNNGQVSFTPKKDNNWDHIVDACRYGVINLFGVDEHDGATSRRKGPIRSRTGNYLSREVRNKDTQPVDADGPYDGRHE